MTTAWHPIDWSSLLDELAYLLADEPLPGQEFTPLGSQRLACKLGISRGALRNMRDGTRPRYDDGARWIELWSRLTGQGLDFLPRLGLPRLGLIKPRHHVHVAQVIHLGTSVNGQR